MNLPPLTTTYLLIGLCFVMVCAPFVARAYQKRKGFLAAWAAARGWKFDPNSKPSDGAPYSHFPQFKRGQAQCALSTARNPITLSGRKLNLICGEFHYIGHFSFGRRQHLRRFSYLLVQVPASAENRLMIRRRRFGDRAGAVAWGFGVLTRNRVCSTRCST